MLVLWEFLKLWQMEQTCFSKRISFHRGNGLFCIGPSITSIAILLSFSVIPFSSCLTLADLNTSIFMDCLFRYCYKMFAANLSGFEFSSLVFSLLGNLKRRIICLSYIYCKVPSVSIAIRFYLKFGGASVVENIKMACCVSRTCLEIMLGMIFIFFWNIWHGKLVREFFPPLRTLEIVLKSRTVGLTSNGFWLEVSCIEKVLILAWFAELLIITLMIKVGFPNFEVWANVDIYACSTNTYLVVVNMFFLVYQNYKKV